MQQQRGRQPLLQQLQEHLLLLQQIQHRLVLQQVVAPDHRSVCDEQQQLQQQQHNGLHRQAHDEEQAQIAPEKPQEVQQEGEPHQQPQTMAQHMQPPLSPAHLHEAANFSSGQSLDGSLDLQQAVKEQQQQRRQQQQQCQQHMQQQEEKFLLKQQQGLLKQQQLLLQLGGIRSPHQLNLAIHLVQRQLLIQRSAGLSTAAATAAAAAAATDLPVGSTTGKPATGANPPFGTAQPIRIAKQHAAYLNAAAAAGGQPAHANAGESQAAVAAAAVSQLLARQKVETAVQQLNAPAIRWWGGRQVQEQQQLLLQVKQLALLLQQQPELQWLLLQDQRLIGLLDTQPGLLLLLLRNHRQRNYRPLLEQLLRGGLGIQQKQQQQQQQQQTPLAIYAKLLSGATQEDREQQRQVQQHVKSLQHERQRLTSLVKQQLQQQQQQQRLQTQQQHQQPQQKSLQTQQQHQQQQQESLQTQQQQLLLLHKEQQEAPLLQQEPQHPLPQQQQEQSPQERQGLLPQEQQQRQPPPHEQQQQQHQPPQKPKQQPLPQRQRQQESIWPPEGCPSQQHGDVHTEADMEEEQQPTQLLTGGAPDSVGRRHEQRRVISAEAHSTVQPSPGPASVPAQSQQESQQEQQQQPMQPQLQSTTFDKKDCRRQQAQPQKKHKQHKQQEPHQKTQQQPRQQPRNTVLRENAHPYSYRSVPDVATETETAEDAATAAQSPAKPRRRCSRFKGEPAGPELPRSRSARTAEANCEGSSNSCCSSNSNSSTSGDENRPPLQQPQRQRRRGGDKNKPKTQRAKQRTVRGGLYAAPAADAPTGIVVATLDEEAAHTPTKEAQPVCRSQGSRGAAAASRATIAASAALQCNGKPKTRSSNTSAAKPADGEQLNQQQLQLLLTLLQDWCSNASSPSSPPPADASASLVARLTAAQPLLERLKQDQQQQAAMLQTAEGHSEAVSCLCSARSAGIAYLKHLLSWSCDQQQQQLPHQLLMSAMKTPEIKDKRSRRPVQSMRRLRCVLPEAALAGALEAAAASSMSSSSSNSLFAALCGCVAVALHAEAALLSLGIDPSEVTDLQQQDQQQQQQQHEEEVSLVSAAAACFKTHCRDTLMPLFSRQIGPMGEDNADERSAIGGHATAAADAAVALQRLLEGLRYLWSVTVSLQHRKIFNMESFHLLAAGLCSIWDMRTFNAISIAAAPLLRSAEGLLLLVFRFVPQLREPVIDGLLQQFATAAGDTCSQKAGGKHAAAVAAAAAAAAMEEEGEEVVGPQQVPAGTTVTAAHPVTLLLLRLLQAVCLPSEVYRHIEGSSFAAAPCKSFEKQKKQLSTRAEGAAAAAAATAKYIARCLIIMAVGEELPGKQQQQQQPQEQLLLLYSLRSSAGCLRAVRRLIADLSLLTLSSSHPASLLLLRTVGFTLLARILRPDAAADHTQQQQQQQTALLSLLSALAPAVFAEPLPVPAVPLLREQQQQQRQQQLGENGQSDTTAGTATTGSCNVGRGPTQTERQQQLRSRCGSFEPGSKRSAAAGATEPVKTTATEQTKQRRDACCDCASLKPQEFAGAAATAPDPWVCPGCELRRSVAMSLQEAIDRLRPSAWLSVAAAAPARSAGTTAAATAAAQGIADSSLLLYMLDEALTFRCMLLMHSNANCSSSKPAASAAQPTAKEQRDEQTPGAAAAAVSAAAASSAASTIRLPHRCLLQQHSRAAMACLLLLLGGASNKKCTGTDSRAGSLKESTNESSEAHSSSSSSRMLKLVIDIEWEAVAAGDVGLLMPLSAAAATAAAGSDIYSPWQQQQQQQQLGVSIWRSLTLSALQQIGDLLLHAVQVSAMDPRLSVRRAAVSVLHVAATWRPSLLHATSSGSNSGIALLLPQALADPSPGVRERALALLDTALKQQQRDAAAAAALQRSGQQQLGDAQPEQQPRIAVSPWLEEMGGLLRFLRYVVLQDTAPSVRQQALRVARGCAAAAPLGETARCCRSLLLEALAAAPDHPLTKAFVTGALATEVVRFLAPKSPEKAAAAASEMDDVAAATAARQTPQKRRSLQGYGGSPLSVAAAQGSANGCASMDLPRAVRLLASLVAAAREHLEDTSLVLLLLPRMQQQLQQQLQHQQTLQELAATLLDACLSEYLKYCCGVSGQQQQKDNSEQQKEQCQQLPQQEDSLLDPDTAGASLLQLAQELGLFCPRGLLQFVPHVAVLLRDSAMLLQQGTSSNRSWLGEIELLAAAANHIRGAPYHMQQEMLLCVPAVLLLLETDPLLLQAGTTMLCRVSLQLQQEGVRDSLLDLLAVSLALIYSIKDRIHPPRQPPQHQQLQEDQQLQEGASVVPMLQALQFASWAVACLAAGLGIGVPNKGSAAGTHIFTTASTAASADQQWFPSSIPGAAAGDVSLLSDIPVALLMRRVAAHATDSKSAAAAAAAATTGDGAFDLQQCIFHLLCDALLLLQQHGGMTAVAWRSVCCFMRAAPSFLRSPRLGSRLNAAIAAAAAGTGKSSGGHQQQQHQQVEWTTNASALDLPAALQALYGLVKGLQRDAAPPGTDAPAAISGGGKALQNASVSSCRSAARPKAERQQQQQQQKQRTPLSTSRAASVAASTATAAAVSAGAITANLRQGLRTGTESTSDTHDSASAAAATAQPSVCDNLHSLAPYVRPMMDLLLPKQQQLQQQQRPWPSVSCSTATLILLLARTLQQLGLLYHSELIPQAAALLFCSSRTVARAASLLLQEALGGTGGAPAAGRLQECLDSSLLLCIHRAAAGATVRDSLNKAPGSGSSSSKLLQLQDEGAEPVAAMLLSPFHPVDPAAVSAFVAFFTKGARGGSRGSPMDVLQGLVAQMRRFSSIEALACLGARLPPVAAAADFAAPVAAEGGPNTRLAAWIDSLPPSLAAVAADPAITPWLQQTPIGLLPLLPAVFAALLHLRLVADVLLSIIQRPAEAADAAAALRGVAVDCGATVDTMLHAAQQQQARQQQHHQVAALTAAFCGCFASHLRSALLYGFHVTDAAEAESDAAAPQAGAAVPENLESHECGIGSTEGAKQQQLQQRRKAGRLLVRQRGRRSSSSSSRSSSSSNIPPPRRNSVHDCDAAEALAASAAAPEQAAMAAAKAAAAAKKSPVSLRRSKCSSAPLVPAVPEEKAAWRSFAAAASLQRDTVATLGRLWASIVVREYSTETGAAADNPAAATIATGGEDARANLIREMVNTAVCCGSELIYAESAGFALTHLHRGVRARRRLQQQQQQQQQHQQQQQSSPPTWRRRKRRRFGIRKGEDPRDSDWARDVETSEPTAESDEDFTDH